MASLGSAASNHAGRKGWFGQLAVAEVEVAVAVAPPRLVLALVRALESGARDECKAVAATNGMSAMPGGSCAADLAFLERRRGGVGVHGRGVALDESAEEGRVA